MVRIVSRGRLIRIFQVPGLILIPVVFALLTVDNKVLFRIDTWNISTLHIGIFFAGTLTVAQFSFWGNYLPTVYPVHLRGTGESMAHNVGGRMLGTSFAALTSMVSEYMPGADDATRVENRLHHRGRRRHVLRQLHARQHSGRRAPGPGA